MWQALSEIIAQLVLSKEHSVRQKGGGGFLILLDKFYVKILKSRGSTLAGIVKFIKCLWFPFGNMFLFKNL